MQENRLDDIDLQMIHALQIEPRVPWAALADLLSVDAVTLSRRWSRIQQLGMAWMTALPGATGAEVGALVEFACTPGEVLRAADIAARDPAIYSIDLTAGERDFVATLGVRDDHELADYALDRLGAIPGVRSVRTHVVNEVLRLGSDWSLQALSPQQQRRIPPARPPRAGSAKHIDPALAGILFARLQRDGRASYVELGAAAGVSAQRAADAVARLRADGKLVLRTDVAAPYSNWPIAVWFFLQAPAASIVSARRTLREMATLQYASVTTGPYNVIVAAGVRNKAQILRLEADLEGHLPGARIVDRSMVLRVHKHLGRMIDTSGRAIVPAAG